MGLTGLDLSTVIRPLSFMDTAMFDNVAMVTDVNHKIIVREKNINRLIV